MSRSRLRLESLSPSSRCRLLDLCVVQRLHKEKHNDKTDKSLRHAAEDDLSILCKLVCQKKRGARPVAIWAVARTKSPEGPIAQVVHKDWSALKIDLEQE